MPKEISRTDQIEGALRDLLAEALDELANEPLEDAEPRPVQIGFQVGSAEDQRVLWRYVLELDGMQGTPRAFKKACKVLAREIEA